MKKTIVVIMLLSVVIALFSGCTGSPAATENTTEKETGKSTGAAVSTPAPSEGTAEVPPADGQLIEAHALVCYLPNALMPTEYNGTLGVYVFYTGEYTGIHPTGLEFSFVITSESNTNGDLRAYAVEASEMTSRANVEPEEVEINGHTWLRFTVNAGNVNYYTVFNGGLYEVTTFAGGESIENYNAAKQMFEKTVHFVIPKD